MNGTGIRTYLRQFVGGGYDDILWRAWTGVGLALIGSMVILWVAETNRGSVDSATTRNLVEQWLLLVATSFAIAAQVAPRWLVSSKWDLPGFGYVLRAFGVLWVVSVVSTSVAAVF